MEHHAGFFIFCSLQRVISSNQQGTFAMPQKPKTPGVVIAAAIILIIVGGFSLVGGTCGGIGMVAAAMSPQQAGPARPGDAMAPMQFFIKEIPTYLAFMMICVILDTLCGIGQLVAA